MKIIAKITAGSRLYGLDTPESDTDTRGVFLSTSPSDILGLGRFEIFKRESEDAVFFELRHFLAGLKRTNTNMLELLHADEEDFETIDIFPLKAFVDYGILDVRLANCLDNLQPMLEHDNISKSAKYDRSSFEDWLRSKGVNLGRRKIHREIKNCGI